jgi:hypothetical protein
MQAYQRKPNHIVPEPKARKKVRILLVTDATWVEFHADRNDESGFTLRLATDGNKAELTIENDKQDEAYPALQIYRDQHA